MGSQKNASVAPQSACLVHGVTHTELEPMTTGLHSLEVHSASLVQSSPSPRPGVTMPPVPLAVLVVDVPPVPVPPVPAPVSVPPVPVPPVSLLPACVPD